MSLLAREASAQAQLARLGFHDVAAVAVTLDRLGLGPDPRDTALLADLAGTADPDVALAGLAALVEGAGTAERRELVETVRADAGIRLRLVRVLGASPALGESLARWPQLWHVLADHDAAAARPSRLGLHTELMTAVTDGPESMLPADRLRVGYRRLLLGLAARDLTDTVGVDDVAAELADLADATLAAALELARRDTGIDAAVPLAIVGMGKCGGRELNYVSDVDVIFVTDTEEHLRPATALASAVMTICSASTAAGTIWPVDAALRPEGTQGALVRTLASHLGYYQRWARTWEFQALLKARPAAGDLALGAQFVDGVAPLVWDAAGRRDFVSDVQEMRRRVVRELRPADRDREVKLGPGGLRDVEFSVQLLQLVHGRGDVSLRSPTTLVALAALASGGYVGREDAASLASAYRFLRREEHLLQLQRLRRTHLLPTEETGLRRLARAMALRDVAGWRREHSHHVQEVRRLHEKLFYRPLLDAVARLPSDGVRLTPDAATTRLAALGFADPAGALRHLEALTSGVSRDAAILRTLLPAMLPWFADAADPDAGLLSFRQVSEALGSTPWYLRVLRDEGETAQRLAGLLATSRYVAELLARGPESVALLGSDEALRPRAADALAAEMLSIVRRGEAGESAVLAARALRRRELLRVACGDLLGLTDIGAVGTALSDITVATLRAALEAAARAVMAERRIEALPRIAVIGMGRLGGGEVGYSSDADLMFVTEPTASSGSDAAGIAQDVVAEMRRLLLLPAADPALTIDTGLRPEGRQGPVVRTLASYAEYYQRWSVGWETQALLRAVPVAGDPDLGRRFVEMVAPLRYSPDGLSTANRREIRRLKARMETERLPRGVDPARHVKLGRGGLSDVEWTVQLVQLDHAGRHPELQVTGTVESLHAARDLQLLSPQETEVLEVAWTTATAVRNGITLALGRSSDVLPGDGRSLAAVSRVLGYPAGAAGELLEDYQRVTRRARAVHEDVFSREA